MGVLKRKFSPKTTEVIFYLLLLSLGAVLAYFIFGLKDITKLLGS